VYAALIMALVVTVNGMQLNKLDLFIARYLDQYMTKSVAPFHYVWTRALTNPELRRIYFESTRFGAKSTLCTFGNTVYQGVESKNPELRIISQSGGSKGLSTKMMRMVKKEFEQNTLLRQDYQYRQGDPWTTEHIQLIRADGSTFDIYSLGKGCSIRGARGDILIDDPQDKLDCESETVLQHDEEWFFSDVLPILSSENRLIFVATPISPLSLAAKVKTLPGFTVFSSPLEVPVGSGHSCWPDMHPDWYLAEQKAVMGIERFNAEYNCLPTVSGNPVFRAEWFKHYDPASPEFERIKRELQYIVVGMDCAESRADQADYTALVTLGMTYGSKPDVYVLDVRRGKWSTRDGASQLFLIHPTWNQHKSIVESRVTGTALEGGDAMIQEIRQQQITYGRNVNLYPFKPVHDKVTRAMSVQPFCQEGRVYMNLLDKTHQELLSELTMFTGTQNYHDDLVDAFDSALYDIQTRGQSMISPAIVSELNKADW